MNYKIGDVIEDASSYKYGMVYVVIEKDKAVYVPYFDNYPAPIEPLNEEKLIFFKSIVRESLEWCLKFPCKEGICFCIHPKEIETECWTPRVLGNIKDLIIELKSKKGVKNGK